MDPILTELLAFPPHPTPTPPLTDGEYDRQARSHLQLLEKLPVSKLAVKVVGGSDVIDVSATPRDSNPQHFHIVLIVLDTEPGYQFFVISPRSPRSDKPERRQTEVSSYLRSVHSRITVMAKASRFHGSIRSDTDQI